MRNEFRLQNNLMGISFVDCSNWNFLCNILLSSEHIVPLRGPQKYHGIYSAFFIENIHMLPYCITNLKILKYIIPKIDANIFYTMRQSCPLALIEIFEHRLQSVKHSKNALYVKKVVLKSKKHLKY